MTDEGQPINRQLVFAPKEATFSKQPLAFPFGESGERMRADRGQIEFFPMLPSVRKESDGAPSDSAILSCICLIKVSQPLSFSG